MTYSFARAGKQTRLRTANRILTELSESYFLRCWPQLKRFLIQGDMEQSVNELETLLGSLKKNITELLPSFEETVEQQAEKLASKQKKELRRQFKTEQEKAKSECRRIRHDTEERVKEIGRIMKKFALEYRRDHTSRLKAIAYRQITESKDGIEHAITVATSQEGESGSLGELQRSGMPENPPSIPDIPRCATCAKESLWLYFCEACRITRYCDEKCQEKDWINHKSSCAGLRHI